MSQLDEVIDREVKRAKLLKNCQHVISEVPIPDPVQENHRLEPFFSKTVNKMFYPCVKCGVFCIKPKKE